LNILKPPVFLKMQTNTNTAKLLSQLYMTQAFDYRAKMLQKTGHLGTFPSSKGQEHLYVLLANHLSDTDWYCPYYRDHGALIARGMPIHALFQFWAGDERGNAQTPKHTLPINIPIGSQCSHAVGVAWSLKKTDGICVVTLGDGATSKGEVYESINFAQIHQLPILFVVNNNKLAISTSIESQSSNPSVANKFANILPTTHIGYENILEMDKTIQTNINRVKESRSPLLMEIMTYRLDSHTTNDDALLYRPLNEIESETLNYPITQLEKLLLEKNHLSSQEINNLKSEASSTVDNAADYFLSIPPQKQNDLRDHLYASL
jgi:2-oxoisovalerate dehydrogenase E1 component alpha subunit